MILFFALAEAAWSGCMDRVLYLSGLSLAMWIEGLLPDSRYACLTFQAGPRRSFCVALFHLRSLLSVWISLLYSVPLPSKESMQMHGLGVY